MRASGEVHLDARAESPVAYAAWHSLAWLIFANAIGVLLALLLLFPALNTQLGEWTYGRLLLFAEALLCIALGRGDTSHHRPVQFLSLASLLLWLPITPAYYARFQWHAETRLWRTALLWWWSGLLITGWIFFLPGVLDYFKFTDGLVGHSFVAMAGFASSLIIFAMVQMLGDGGWIFNGKRSFVLWHVGVIAYVILMTIAGWREGSDASFTIVPGLFRNTLYTLRLLTGVMMLVASIVWLADASKLLRQAVRVPDEVVQEKIA